MRSHGIYDGLGGAGRDALAAVTADPTPPGALTVVEDRRDGTIVLALAGELDLMTTPLVRQALDRIGAQHASRVVIDLRGLSFIDSTGIHLIVDAHQRLGGHRLPTLEIWRGPDEIHRLFEIVGLDAVLPFVAAA